MNKPAKAAKEQSNYSIRKPDYNDHPPTISNNEVYNNRIEYIYNPESSNYYAPSYYNPIQLNGTAHNFPIFRCLCEFKEKLEIEKKN